MMSGVRRIAELRVFAGGTLGANGFEINGREDGVLRLGAAGGSFLEQRYRGLAAARAMKDVDVEVRHGSSPVDGASICLARYKPVPNDYQLGCCCSRANSAGAANSFLPKDRRRGLRYPVWAFSLLQRVKHFATQQSIGLGLIPPPVLLKPGDNVGIQPHRDRPFDGPVHLTAHRATQLFYCELGNVRSVNLIVSCRRHSLQFFLAPLT